MKGMKRELVVLTVLLCAVSCNEKAYPEIPDAAESIIVRTQVGETKAGYEGNTVLPSVFIMDISQGGDAEYDYSLLEMTKESTGNVYNAPEDVTLLWADDDHSNVFIKAMTIPSGLSSVDPENPMTVNVCLDQTEEAGVIESDLLGATSDDGITVDGNSVVITFSHLLTKLCVEYAFSDEFSDNEVSVNSLSFRNVCVTGGYSYAEMAFDESADLAYGDIKMYHNPDDKAAEAIFYPYIPSEDPVLVINTTIDGTVREFECPVSLPAGTGFKSGKRYKMKVTISGTSISDASVTLVKDWEDAEAVTGSASSESVLWIGTSIPGGNGDNNYPKMVADALGFKLYNHSRGASFVCFYDKDSDGCASITDSYDSDTENSFKKKPHLGYSLSATVAEVEAKFNRTDFPEEVLPEWLLESFKDHSFERLIIPYIDGTKASCSTIIFDHGYNDRAAIVNECANHPADGDRAPGYAWLMTLADNSKQTSELYIQDCWNNDNNTSRKNSYLYAMSYLVKRCLEANPRVRIIFGNYFAWKTPQFAWEYGNDNCCNLLCGANEALAGMWMRDIVNVYKYTGIRNFNGDFNLFCPDGVHPHSDTTGESNRIIAGIYINELNGIFNVGQ